MEDISGGSVPLSLTASRYTDDRASSDSGISSRGGGSSSSSSAGSGSSDERSGSRSSALSSLGDEGGGGGGGGGGSSSGSSSSGGSLQQHHHHHQQQLQQQQQQQQQLHHHQHLQQQHHQQQQVNSAALSLSVGVRKSPNAVVEGATAASFYHPHHPSAATTVDGVRVWRDPNLLLDTGRSVRHIDSVQHQSLLMSHPAVVAGSPSSSAASAVSPASGVAAPSTPAAHYPPTVVPMITPHPLHHQLPPHNLYTSSIPEMLWKPQRFPVMPMTAAHLHHPVAAEEMLVERERAYAHDRERQDRLHREREQEREVEKREREKHQLERERQENDRLEKQRAAQAVHEHFKESLKLASQKSQHRWSLINSLPPPVTNVSSALRVSEEDRKRMIDEQARFMKQDIRSERDKIAPLPNFSPYSSHIPKSSSSSGSNSSSKHDYLTVAPVASRDRGGGGSSVKSSSSQQQQQQQMLPKSADSGYNIFGYPAYQPPLNFTPAQDAKLKSFPGGVVMNSLAGGGVVSIKNDARDGHLVSMSQHPSDMKNSVIVKNEGKLPSSQANVGPPTLSPQTPQHHLLVDAATMHKQTTVTIPAHSSSPKSLQQHQQHQRSGGEPHYLAAPQQSAAIKSQHEYHHRSPNQSPLHATYAAATSPHQQQQQLHVIHDERKLQQQQQQQQQHHHRQGVLPGPPSANTPTSASGGAHHRQSPLPPPPRSHRQSPHHRQSPLPAAQAASSPLPPQHHMHHRQSPHSLPPSAVSPPDQRYSPAGVNLYQKAPGPPTGAYGYPSNISGPGGQLLHPAQVAVSSVASIPSSQQSTPTSSLSKPKVSSPAPHHIYGKPNSGITSGTPVCRPSPQQEISLSPVPPSPVSGAVGAPPAKGLLTPSPYQQLSRHQPPPCTISVLNSSAIDLTPPPAHSSRTTSRYPEPTQYPDNARYAPMSARSAPHITHRQMGSGSPATSAPGTVSDLSLLSVAASTATSVSAHQVQPLDLGVKDSSSSSSSSSYSSSSSGPPILQPAVPPSMLSSSAQLTATELAAKRKWPIDENSSGLPTANEEDSSNKKLCYGDESSSSSRISREPSPSSLTAAPSQQSNVAATSAAPTTIPIVTTTVINVQASTPPPPALSIAVSSPETTTSTCAAVATAPATLPDEVTATVSAAATLQAPPPPCSSPNTTPAKISTSAVDSEKSNSPKPPTYGGHKLKKAWLQRHSGEDVNDEKTSCSKGAGATASSSVNGSLSISNTDNDGTNVPPSTTGLRANSPSAQSTVTTKDSNNDVSALTSLNNSINSIGSMAVNSISKSRPAKGGGGKKSTTTTPTAANKDRASPVVLNGHVSPKTNVRAAAAAAAASYASDESSSSETESSSATTTKSSPKRVPPKVKRKKTAAQKGSSKNAAQANAAAAAAAAAAETEDAAPKRRKLNSTSSTDSDKESASEKESDNSSSAGGGGGKKTSGSRSGGGGSDDKKDSNSRKRGRRPKVSGSYSPAGGKDGAAAGNGASGGGGGDSPKEKKFRGDDKDQKDPFAKPPISQLKKTGESFLQDGPCFEVAPKLAKCRECRWTPNQRSRSNTNIFCRFYAFRRLRYTKNGQLAIAGFSDPHKDATQDDVNLWLPNYNKPPTDLDLEMARFMLSQVGDQFCDLLTQEIEAINIHISEDKKIAWKRVVQGVREMCDVCETTLFNFHWACSKCGFVVCIDCYKGRKNGTIKIWGEVGKDRDDLSWLLCTNRQAHEQEKLMLTQIIAGDSLMTLKKLAHESRAMWDVPMYCGCELSQTEIVPSAGNGICKEILRNLKQEKQRKAQQQVNGGAVKSENGDGPDDAGKKSETNDSTKLDLLANVALNQNKASVDDAGESSSDSDDGNYSTLRELLVRPNKANGNGSSQPTSPTPATQQQQSSNSTTGVGSAAAKSKQKKSQLNDLDEVISTVGGDNHDNTEDYLMDRSLNGANSSIELKYFVRTYSKAIHGRVNIPIRIMTVTESQLLYPNTPHQWLCDGKLLRLLDPQHSGNYTIFQDQWKRGQPVIVSDVTKRLDPNLWHPDSFAKDFGDNKNDLINCMTGKTVPNQQMRKFWEGFEYQSKRLKDDKGNAMLLKLKDWPPGEDFAEMLPSRYQDLMNVLPLGEYTQRNGKLNLASRLPECFVRPDLGPKMYNAYGSAIYPHTGTTNLHLDISDAVNVMVYVSIPKDGDNDKHMKEAYRAIDEAGCDFLSRRRARDSKTLPGALWHIYAARDADKIRDLLNKVAIERGARLEPNHDPIHDQSWYLDGTLRERLKKEYEVEGYAIVQCLGDAVFVPAGTPHQVRNLLNCIKIAEDFVSPENVSHCFHLTQEFRDLSDTHSNHEDKLQIKNIMYHAVKDSLSVLGATLNQNADEASDVKIKSESSDS